MTSVILLLAAATNGPLAPAAEVHRLDNGLRVMLLQDHDQPWVSVQVWHNVGTAHDPPARPGMCRVALHCVAQREHVQRQLESCGVWTATTVQPDACGLLSAASPAALESLLTLESRRFAASAPDADAISAALATASDVQPPTLAERILRAGLFRDHGYAQPPTLVTAALTEVGVEEMGAYIDRWFAPENATLLIVGNFDVAAALTLVKEHFEPLPWRSVPQHARQDLPPPERVELEPVNDDAPGVTIAWLTPRRGRFENAALDVLMHRLGNPVDGALCQALREVGAGPVQWRRLAHADAGYLQLTVQQVYSFETLDAPSFARLVEERLRAALTVAATNPAAPIELNRARALAKRDVRHSLDSIAEQVRNLGIATVVGGDWRAPRYALSRIDRVNVGDVQAAARALLDARCVILPLSPFKSASQPTLPALLAIDDFAAECDLLGRLLRLTVPRLFPRGEWHHDSWVLNDGVRIDTTTVPGRLLAEVRTRIPGSSPAASTLVHVGSAHRAPAAYRRYETYHGIELCAEPTPHRDIFDLVATGPPDKVPQMIELQLDLLRHPRGTSATFYRNEDQVAAEELFRLLAIQPALVVRITGDIDLAELRSATTELWGRSPP